MKQRQTRWRRVSLFFAVVFFAVCLLIVSFVMALKVTTPEPEYAYRAGEEQEDFADANFEHKGKWYGLCAKNSIHSVDDFHRTVSNDPVLKTHYADFRWENAKMGRAGPSHLGLRVFQKG